MENSLGCAIFALVLGIIGITCAFPWLVWVWIILLASIALND